MSGDYSKHRFDPNRDYSGVLMQQGRVQLDADWNEQVEIQDRRLRAETADIVGRCGVPQETPDGFKIELAGGALTIGEGRIYVDGLLAENHGAVPKTFDTVLAELRGTASLAYDEQPYLLQPPLLPAPPTPPPSPPGLLLIYLDVWQREVTLVKDRDLLEKAVGVDTTTRLQTVWQVRFLEVGADVTCATPIDEITLLQEATRPSAGRLSTVAIGVDPEQDPCVIPPSGGFRGLENRLYRVEIHKPGLEGIATFKWSADNTVLTTTVTGIDSTRKELTVETTRKDSILQFQGGDWVEVTNDIREFAFQPGEMREVADVDHGAGTITLTASLPSGEFPTDGSVHTRVRRWDQKGQILDRDGNVIGDVGDNGGVILVPNAAPVTSIQLNDGVIVTFATDPEVGRFRVGDYWNFAARTADASVEKLIKAPPRGIHHHYCRLALLEALNAEPPAWAVRDDCRPLFPPLTQLTHFYYVSGDGQEAPTPDLRLPKPLQVAVFNGHKPVSGASVRFEIVTATAGSLSAPNVTSATVITVETDVNGIAECTWDLEVPPPPGSQQQVPPPPVSQQVEATLRDDAGQTLHHPIRFNATPTREHEPGIRVKDVELLPDEDGDGAVVPLLNDARLTAKQLAQGILLVCDDLIDDSSVKPPTCFVTVDIPNVEFNGPFAGSRTTIVLDGEPGVTSDDGTDTPTGIFWKPTNDARILLDGVISGIAGPLLVRLTVKGNFIFGPPVSPGLPGIYLDGETYGVPGPESANGKTPTHLDSSDGSGDRRRGGDFEMWFWIDRGTEPLG